MSCREFKADLIEIARGGEAAVARRHAAVCPRCAEFLEDQRALTSAFHALASEPVEIPPMLAAAQRPVWRGRVAAGLGLAAGIALVWLAVPRKPAVAPMAISRPAPPAKAAVPVPIPVQTAVRRHRAKPVEEPPFIQFPYAEPLAPEERAELVRVVMPVAAIIAAGFPVQATDAGAHATADLIVGEDGRARAIRLISISERSSER